MAGSGFVRVPLLQQPAVCCYGAAAAKSPEAADVAEGAHNAACCVQPGESRHTCIPLMHLATSWTAVALQPDPFAAFVSEVSRPAGSVPPGMPPACDAVIVWVCQSFVPVPAACRTSDCCC